MKQVLAERLLAKVMNWSDDQVKAELNPLLLLAEAKYDHYHQFGPGMRFIERLGRWLNQVSIEDRAAAFEIVRDHLIFISSAEMHSLIEMAYPELILPLQRRVAGQRAVIEPHRIIRIERSEEFKSLVAKTLYIGLSDGSQIGNLRRLNPRAIEHERTLLTYSLDEEKATEVSDDLRKALESAGVAEDGAKYELAVLVDDFTASGISFIRSEGGAFKGKLARVLRNMQAGPLEKLVDISSVHILVLFYVSTKTALNNIRAGLAEFCTAERISSTILVEAVYKIDDSAVGVASSDVKFEDLLARRFEPIRDKVIDPSYIKGRHEKPHRGFNESDLPLILYHNSPNNSLPMLWFDSEEHLALFPRTTRHGRK